MKIESIATPANIQCFMNLCCNANDIAKITLVALPIFAVLFGCCVRRNRRSIALYPPTPRPQPAVVSKLPTEEPNAISTRQSFTPMTVNSHVIKPLVARRLDFDGNE